MQAGRLERSSTAYHSRASASVTNFLALRWECCLMWPANEPFAKGPRMVWTRHRSGSRRDLGRSLRHPHRRP